MKDSYTRRAAVSGLVGAAVAPSLSDAQQADRAAGAAGPLAGENIFPDIASGLAATRPGSSFWTTTPPNLYLNNAGSAQLIAELATLGRSLGAFNSPLVDNGANLTEALESIGINLAEPRGSHNIGFVQNGAKAKARPAEAKLREIAVSAQDFGAKGDGRADDTAALRDAVNRLGALVTPGTSVELRLPNGTYLTDPIGMQGVMLSGETRLGTVLKARSGGPEGLLDARINRDGRTPNTSGNMMVENLSIDLAGHARLGLAAYGGSCMARNLEIYNSGRDALLLQYVLKTTLENVTCRNNRRDGFVINVDEPLHTGDVNTSINMTNCWSLANGRHGVKAQNINYCVFDNVTTQGSGSNGWEIDGSLGGVVSANCIVFNCCASEEDAGRAFNLKKMRNFMMITPFVLAAPNQHTIFLDDCLGTIVGFTDMAVHKGGTSSLRVVNPPVLGGVILQGGDFKMPAREYKFCSFQAAVVNGTPRNSLNQLWLNDTQDVQAMSLQTSAFATDYSGLAVTAQDGTRSAFFSRAGGMVIASSRGSAIDTKGMNNGDIYMWAGTTALNFIVKGTDGVVRNGSIRLS